jgi:hypothetical protein
MPKKRVVVAIGDAGSAEYLLPAYRALINDFDINLYADPKGAGGNVLKKAGIPLEWCESAELDLGQPSLVLCGTAGKAQRLWRDFTLGCRRDVPIAWFGDFYNSGCEEAMRGLSPDYMAAFDESSAAAFMKVHPTFPATHLAVVGNPAYDTHAMFNLAEVRTHTREALKIGDEKFVIYSASSFKQFKLAEVVGTLIPWVKRRGYRFAMRFHPADAQSEPETVGRVKVSIKETLGKALVDIGDLGGLVLAASADLFVTDYSTEGVKASLAGVPTAFIMFESARAYQRSRGLKAPYFSVLDDKYEVSPANGALLSQPS